MTLTLEVMLFRLSAILHGMGRSRPGPTSMPSKADRRTFLSGFVILAACSSAPSGTGVTPSNHLWFPLGAGTTHVYGRTVSDGGTLACDSCHTAQDTFVDFACTSCHDHSPGITDQLHLRVAGYAYGAQTCLTCHTTGAHAAIGTTAGSTLDCNGCHGQTGTASVHLAVAAANHYGVVSNGNTCTSCHVNFASFKDATENLFYAHTNGAANSGGCVTCHAFVNQMYTTLTTTPSLSYPVSSGGHTFSQTTSVTGSFDSKSFTANHTATKMTNCGACHQYSNTTASTNIWAFEHRPRNSGISNRSSSSGCNSCH